MSELNSVRPLKVADLNARRIVGDFGITAAIATGRDYDESQTLAAERFDAGFEGIRYKVRHDPTLHEQGLAVFGEAGEFTGAFSIVKTEEIPSDLIEQGQQFGISVIPSATLL